MINSISNQNTGRLSLKDEEATVALKKEDKKDFVRPAIKIDSNDDIKKISYDSEPIKKLLEEANKRLEQRQVERFFEYNEEIHRNVIRLVDKKTKEVIYQVPSEVAIKIAKDIDRFIGLLTDRTA